MTLWRGFIDNNTGRLEGNGSTIPYWTDKTVEHWLKFARENTRRWTAIAYDDETGKVMFLEDFEENVS